LLMHHAEEDPVRVQGPSSRVRTLQVRTSPTLYPLGPSYRTYIFCTKQMN